MMIQRRWAGKDTMPESKIKGAGLLLLSVMLMPLSGCGGSDYSDLRGYIKQVKAKPAGRIAPVPEFESYQTFEYSAMNERDPFQMFLNEAQIVQNTTGGSGLAPDFNRNKETLEQYPLDTLNFVGHLERGGERWAIVTSPDDLVHRVKVGNHIGMNYGEITAISELKIEVKEIIPDGMGGWIERAAALSLSE